MIKIADIRFAILLVGLIGTMVAGCARPEASAEPRGENAAKVPEKRSVVSPKRMSVVRLVEQPGGIQAYEKTYLFARVPGYVGKVRVDIGDTITSGQALADLNVPEMHEEAKQKQALVRQATAEVEQAEKALASAVANVAVMTAGVIEAKAFHDRWESESKRMAALVRGGVIDTQARDETVNQYQAGKGKLALANASVQKAVADRDRASADLRASKARIDVHKAEAARMEAMLKYASIRAPYDGVVTVRKVNTGDFVQPASGKDDFLFAVARIDPVRVVLAVPEADASLVHDKSPVSLHIGAARATVYEGAVTRTSWALAQTSRTLRAEIDLPNKDGHLRPGMYVYAKIKCQLPENWVVPASAVVKQGDSMVCFVVIGGKAVQTPVQVGHSDGQWTQLLGKSGSAGSTSEAITGQERIVAQAAGVSDGQAVEP